MGFFSIFKTRDKIQGAGATLYPDKIVIGTINRIKNSYGVVSANVTVINANEDSEALGQILRKHLHQSRDNLKERETGEYKEY